MQTILLTGGTGFIGSHFCMAAVAQGHQVIVLTRNIKKARVTMPAAVRFISDLSQIEADQKIDAIVNLAGESLGDKRWSESRKALFFSSRVDFTDKLYRFFAARQQVPKVVVSGSAVGYYGPSEEAVDETSDVVDGFSHQLCGQWENSAHQFESLGSRVCLLRTGIVLGRQGALSKMLPPFRLGLGGPVGDGHQFMSWIHIEDMVRVIKFCIDNNTIVGAINATAPHPERNKDFSRILGGVLRRPASLPMPSWMIKLLFGQMGVELLLQGQQVIPKKLTQTGFEFIYQRLPPALENIVGSEFANDKNS